MIKWGIENHLRVFLLITPFTDTAENCGYQSDLMESTQTFVSYPRLKGASPTEFGVANYCGDATNTKVNYPAGDDVIGSLNQVALWLATQPLSPAGSAQPFSPDSKSQAQLELSSTFYKSKSIKKGFFTVNKINIKSILIKNQ